MSKLLSADLGSEAKLYVSERSGTREERSDGITESAAKGA